MFTFPPGLGVCLMDSAWLHQGRYVIQHHCKSIKERCLNSWFTQLKYDNYLMKWKYSLCDYPIEIERLMGSETLFIMEGRNRQQDCLKAHDVITENCFIYGISYVLWLSHFIKWSIWWKPLDYKLVPTTSSFLHPQYDLLIMSHWRGKDNGFISVSAICFDFLLFLLC